jgi:hypothetical protein
MTTEAIPNTNAVASLAAIGYGSALSIGVGLIPSSATYTQIIEITDIDPSGIEVGKEEVTHLGSLNATKEYVPGLIEPGTLGFEGNWVGGDTTLASVLTAIGARTKQCFQVQVLSNGASKITTIQGVGFLTKFNPLGKVTADKAVKYSGEVQFTGTVTYTEI